MFNVVDSDNYFYKEFNNLDSAINWIEESLRLPEGDYVFNVSLDKVYLLTVRVKSYGQIDSENMYVTHIDIPGYTK